MTTANPWFKLPEEDEKVLQELVERHGIGRILAVSSRVQVSIDKQAREAEKILRSLGPDELGL